MIMKQVWGIGKRKFQDDFKRRIMPFDYLVVGVMLYGIELFGWKERIERERIQQKYIRSCLDLEICTPGYVSEMRSKSEQGREQCNMKKEKRNITGMNILKECLKEKEREMQPNQRTFKRDRNTYEEWVQLQIS